MRQMLFIVALMSALGTAGAAETESLKTNSVTLGAPGSLEILTPPSWTLAYTNLNLPDHPVTFELHAPSNTIVIRFYVRWDGFQGASVNPTEAQMGVVVSNSVASQFMPVAAEKQFMLEKFKGADVTLILARVTDSTWTPVVRDSYPNVCEGMFRSEHVWGNFNVLTYDKDGPYFKEALKVLESMRRKS